jgi:hypothetical protein
MKKKQFYFNFLPSKESIGGKRNIDFLPILSYYLNRLQLIKRQGGRRTMSENEDKGFVFKDRRKIFSESEKEAEAKKTPPQEEPVREKVESKETPPPPPLPEVNFSTFIVSLSTEVLFHLGEFPHPVSGEKKKDLVMAKHVIDTLSMLKEKTQGNLTEDEQKLMEGMLYDLRMAFIRAK